MQRFIRTQRESEKRRAFPAAVFSLLAVLALFLFSMRLLEGGTVRRQEDALRTAVNRDITICYAWEGRYPESVEYMEKYYGLTYDKNLFTVRYQLRGSNIRPYVTVIRRSKETDDGKGLIHP